jgi:hypothetical protein
MKHCITWFEYFASFSKALSQVKHITVITTLLNIGIELIFRHIIPTLSTRNATGAQKHTR